jgi:hypothetical protein
MSAIPRDDHELERQIDAAYRRMVNAVMADDSRKAWDEMVGLVRQRSPDRIKQMERERRLRR